MSNTILDDDRELQFGSDARKLSVSIDEMETMTDKQYADRYKKLAKELNIADWHDVWKATDEEFKAMQLKANRKGDKKT